MYELREIFERTIERFPLHVVPTETRRSICIDYAWSIPTPEVIEALAALSPITEIGAGTGYWARLLSDAGATIEATDLNPPGSNRRDLAGTDLVEIWHSCSKGYYPVVEMDAVTAAAGAGDRTLMISWPEWGERWSADAVRAYAEAGGQRVIYIGERSDGCCGTPEFFALLGDEACRGCFDQESCFDDPEDCFCRPHTCHVEPFFRRVEQYALPCWEMMHDSVVVYERV